MITRSREGSDIDDAGAMDAQMCSKLQGRSLTRLSQVHSPNQKQTNTMRLAKRFVSAWRRHGVTGLPRLVARNAAHVIREVTSGRAFRRSDGETSAFDTEFGSETARIREVGSLDIDSVNVRHAVRYQPSPHDLAAELIGGLEIDHQRFAFIDFGAGKGRVLMIAAGWPFDAVFGVEFSQELCVVARSNIERLSGARRAARHIECRYQDATHFEVPDAPLVCYFHNPFDEVVVRSVVQRLLASLDQRPRDMYVIYVHPEHRNVFDVGGRWDILRQSNRFVVYGARRPGIIVAA